jgi:Asp-tRNA(Asn)/Glu-tRNA(Gln) amidotransferase A subunit family amidase
LIAVRPVSLPEAARARAAAAIITGCEASNAHLANLRSRPHDFDPLTRDPLARRRFDSGNVEPAGPSLPPLVRARMLELFETVDLVLAPATPFTAPPIGEATTVVGGMEVRTRRHIGAFAQPVSFLGFPSLTVPVARGNRLPIGVAMIAPPWRESSAFRAAAVAEAAGVLAAPVATAFH